MARELRVEHVAALVEQRRGALVAGRNPDRPAGADAGVRGLQVVVCLREGVRAPVEDGVHHRALGRGHRLPRPGTVQMTTAETTPTETHAASDRATGARTLAEMALRATATNDGPALRFARGDTWTEMSYAELGTVVREIARGLIALGIRPGDRVSILSGTRAEWTLVDIGALCAGAVVAPIYHTNSPEESHYVLEHAESRLVFCEDAQQAAKVEQVREVCPALEHVVTFDGSGDGRDFAR